MEQPQSYNEIKKRLDEIVEAVSADDIPIEESLSLYEEAVKLGALVSSYIEKDIEAKNTDLENAEKSDKVQNESADSESAVSAEGQAEAR